MNKLILGLLVSLLFFSKAQAFDRVQLVQSKLQTALSSILPRTDFLITVNRVDTLDDGGQTQVVNGALKMLPGLNLGIDSTGELVQQNGSGSDYNGPVSISLIIDEKIKKQTYQTVEKVLPDIIGGLRDEDSLKVSAGQLRQPAANPDSGAPKINIQNMSDNKNQMQENIKFLALLLLTGGLFFWFLARLNKSDKKSNAHDNHAPPKGTDAKNEPISKKDFSLLDPETISLFLLKDLKAKNPRTWEILKRNLPAAHLRDVLKFCPSWVIGQLESLKAPAQETAEKDTEKILGELFNSIALLEQSFKAPSQRKLAFLKWFPAEALRFVPKQQQADFPEAHRHTLWSLRPELGNFVKVEGMNIDELMSEPSLEAIDACYEHLQKMPSTNLDIGSNKNQSLLSRWASLINSLTEFSPIDSQLQQAKEKLKADEYTELLSSTAHVKTPLFFAEAEQKELLRQIDPDDYYWWCHLTKEVPPWKLEDTLRPMRLAMFRQAEEKMNYANWKEPQRKQSSLRLLELFRSIQEKSKSGEHEPRAS